MKKFLTLVVALVLTIPMMAVGRNDGSTKANAIDFDWDKGVTHAGGTKWYRVDLTPLYQEENPSLTLYLTNPSNVVGSSVDVSMQATVAGQSESKDYTIAARQYKTYTANASMLVRMKQTEIYLTLTSSPKVGTESTIKLSAKVFEAADLDETCKDARTLSWDTEATQTPMYSAWWKVSLKPIKDVTGYDAQITITNTGSKTVNLKIGQSLDCPSSGMTKREYTLAPGEPIVKKVPRDMITNVQPDELYFGIENVESQISIKVEKVAQPPVPVISGTQTAVNLHVTDTIEPMPATTTLYKISVADMDSLAKYEPEFTYRNVGTTPAKVSIKMAFNRPAFSTSDVEYDLGVGEEEIVVYKKNMLEGMDGVDSIYLLTTVTGNVNFYGRFKHVREGKACKTNIDFNWVSGHTQEGRTTQWYAIDVADARDNLKDIMIYVLNQGNAAATVKASMAFSCPYIDLQEITRTIAANGDTLTRRMGYSSYAMMSDTVWIGLETNQDIRFWADTVDALKKAEVDSACMNSVPFNWEEGVMQKADTTVWYKINMDEVRDLAAKFPTVFVQNLSSTAPAVITAELSVECPDSIANQSRSLTIAANESYSKQLSRNLFENIVQDEIYLKVHSTQAISLQIRLTEEAEGASCSSAIPFNWVSGNTQNANDNLWYSVDLRNVMKRGNDLVLHIENRDNAACKGVIQLSYECPVVNAPSVQDFKLAAKGDRSVTIQNSALETLEDSIVYVNLQGTTGLRFWADTLAVQHFDTIFATGLTLIPLQWDSLYTQTTDTAWYIIPKSEIDYIRNLDEKVKPVAHLINLGTKENTIKGEAAFAFPIVKNMMTKSQKVAAGKPFTDTIPASTFDQFLKKDSIILRITRPVGSADFQFRAELVKAFSGNSRNDALPIRMGEQYTQSPMTSMWYKINTADWKKDKTLYNKALNVMTKNAGAGDTKVKVAVYEGLLSDVDMLEEYGLNDYRERTIKKGQGKSHNIPAQAVYGLGDVELYIQVTTTDSIVFNSEFASTYAPLAADSAKAVAAAQAQAKLLVPNVEYVVPADGKEHWYAVCIPYIQNNYEYTADATLTYELNGTATIEGTFTFQDQMDCAMPVRKRTINRSGGYHKGTKLLSELLNKAIKKATKREFDVTTFQPAFVDSMLHRYITDDSITAYIRLKTTQDLKVKLNMKQTTGDACTTPMMFDWEHGNVNPAGANKWYLVHLADFAINGSDTTFYPYIPDTCDLRLHVDNWAADSSLVAADLYFDCNDPATVSKSYKQGANGKDTLDIDRDLLVKLGWSDMIINFNSDKATHIWAELIPEMKYDTLRDTIVAYVCQGDVYIDSIRGSENYKAITINVSQEWNDTMTFQDGPAMRCQITSFQIHPLVTPEALTVDSMNKLGAAPLLVQGMQLFVDSSSVKLTEYYRNLGNTVDTITKVDTVYWAKPVYAAGVLDKTIEAALDLTSYYKKTDTEDTLLLVIVSDTCGFTYRKDIVFPIGDYKYVAKSDTVCPPAPAVNPDTLPTVIVTDTLGRLRQVDTVVTYVARVAPTLYTKAQITNLPTIVGGDVISDTYMTAYTASLQGQFDADADDLTMAVTGIQWQVKVGTDWQDLPYTVKRCETTVTMHYTISAECGHNATSGDIVLAVTAASPTYTTDVVDNVCGSYIWPRNGQTYYSSTTDTYTEYDADGCALNVYTLNLTLGQPNTGDTTAVECNSFTWYGKTYTASTTDTYTLTNVSGCDSVVTLHLTINYSTTGDTTAVECDEFTWYGTKYTTSGDYTHVLTNAVNCDSVVTLHLTINNSIVMPTISVSECNMYEWKDEAQNFDTLITTTGTYTHVFATALGCDSTVTIDATIKGTSYVDTLDIKAYYGNRIIMINRNQINALDGWADLDSLDNEQGKYVEWYRIEASGDTTSLGTGYYKTLPTGEPLPAGDYFAYIDLPRSAGAECGSVGKTKILTIAAAATAAPALVPSLARPGEDIQVINLDPEVETIIRIYSAEGLLQKTYTSYGETSFTIKAANDNGFYIVELNADSIKSTLRYIVK